MKVGSRTSGSIEVPWHGPRQTRQVDAPPRSVELPWRLLHQTRNLADS